MDGASIAALITAIGSIALGTYGLIRSNKAQSDTAAVAERTVAKEEFDSIVDAYSKLHAELNERLVRRDLQVGEMREELANCEADKQQLTRRVDQLEVAVAQLGGPT